MMTSARRVSAILTLALALAGPQAHAGPAVTRKPAPRPATTAKQIAPSQPTITAGSVAAGARTITTADIKPVFFKLDPSIRMVKPNVSLTPAQQAMVVKSNLPALVDLAITNVQPVRFTPQDVEAKGQWLIFNVMVKNTGPGRAVRIQVKAEYQGSAQGWPTRPGYLPELKAGHSQAVSCQLFIPSGAALGGNTFKLTVDDREVNKDLNRANNKTWFKVTIVPERLPDLTITRLDSFQTDKANDFLVNTAYIEYEWKVSVRNGGTAAAPASSVRCQIYRLSEGQPRPQRTWNIPVPPLAPGRQLAMTSPRFKCEVNTTHEFVFTADPDNKLLELREDNNQARDRKSVDHKFHGLAAVAAAVDFTARSAVAGISAAGEYVWEGIKYVSINALAGTMAGGMMIYVNSMNLGYLPLSRPLTAAEKEPLKGYYPTAFLDGIRIVADGSRFNPEFCAGGAAAVTYPNVIVFRGDKLYKGGKFNAQLVAHELVHAYQYKKYTLAKFCWDYMYSYVSQGFSYRDIEFEKEAYHFEEQIFAKGTPTMLSDVLGY